MKKLNLGSGEFLKEGFVNVDFYSVSKPDVAHDLSVFPYPFEDNHFDHVESDHCFEHLPDPFSVMREVHRISKNSQLMRDYIKYKVYPKYLFRIANITSEHWE